LKGLRLLDAKVVNPLPRLEVPPAAAGDALAAGAADVPPGVPRSGDQIIGGILALSAQPAPPGRIGDLPDTNLHALFAVGPYLGPGSPAGVPEGVLGGEGGEAEGPGGLSAGFGGLNTEGIFVAPAGPVPPGPVVVGPATNDATDTTSSALQRAAPAPQPAEPPQVAPRQTDKSARERAEEMLHDTLPGAPRAPARRRIYTIYINMPNLTSQAGSWVLRFAELNEREASWPGGAGEPPLAAPLATKKVDPGYSAAARRDRIEGTVFLYGVIEPDGSVRDVQVVRGLHAALDQRAVEAFQRWRFEPGRKNGAAVALEVVVEIPFHLQALF
jgi:protein TonB